MGIKFIIAAIRYPSQSSLLWTSQTENMLRDKNEEVMICCKTITSNFLTIVRLLVEPSTSLSKPKASLEASLYIRQPPLTLTSSKTAISPSIYIFFSFVNILISNRYWWSTVSSYVGNSAGRCGGRNRTGKINYMADRNCLPILDLNKGRYSIFRGTSLGFKSIVE